MRVLLIGYGSIGKMHYEVLKGLEPVKEVDVLTSRNLDGKIVYRSYEEIGELQSYDYFVIATETTRHYKLLKYLDENVSDKIILCEKPLFEKNINFVPVNNRVYVGYNLRFHPYLNIFKKELANLKTYSANIYCGSYLPDWRERDYREVYSAHKDKGGGVLLDLSHELDYINWLFGEMKILYAMHGKISELEITSDDMASVLGQTANNTKINLSLDYFSKINYRKIIAHSSDRTIEVDLVNGHYIQKKIDEKENIHKLNRHIRESQYADMHMDIIEGRGTACTYDEAATVMKQIDIIVKAGK